MKNKHVNIEMIRKTLSSPSYLLVIFTLKGEELSIYELSKKCNISQSLCYRILKDLMSIGLVKHVCNRRSERFRMSSIYALSFTEIEIEIDLKGIEVSIIQ